MRYEARVKKAGKFNGLRLGYVYEASAEEAKREAERRWPGKEVRVQFTPIEDTADELRKNAEEQTSLLGAF